jgi:hypothetical protein
MQIRAIAIKNGYTDSQEITATYTVGSGVESTPWQMYVSDAEMDYRMNCELREEQIVVYYTDTNTVTLKPSTILYSDEQLTLKARGGLYRDVNDRDRAVIWKISNDNDGQLIETNLSCSR